MKNNTAPIGSFFKYTFKWIWKTKDTKDHKIAAFEEKRAEKNHTSISVTRGELGFS